MKFQRDSTPTPYLNRRDQYRMLGLIGLLMLVVLAIDVARRPENWLWFTSLGAPEPQELRELSLDDVDFQIKPSDQLPPETFVAVTEPSAVPQESTQPSDLRQFPRDLLAGVRDQQLNLVRSEEPALQAVLERVRSVSREELERAAAGDVSYRVVNVEPDQHRGKLMTIEGRLWRLAPYPFGERDSTDDDLVQAWIFTDDSGNHPWFVLLAEKPAGAEYGDQIDRPVRVAGYFFKRYGYPTQGEGLHVAPMLVGKSLSLPPTVAATKERSEDVSHYLAGLLGTLALVFGGMIWWFVASDRKFNRSRLAKIAESRLDAPPEAVAELNDLEAVDPSEVFSSLDQPRDQSSP